MKSLVIYYSKTGNTKLMAETMAEELQAELLAITPQKEIKASGGFGLYFVGGFQSVSKKKIKLEETNLNFDDYDLIILGTPVWAWRLNPVVRSFLKKYEFKDKKFGLFCCCAGSGDGVLENLREILHENEILGVTQFVEPLKKDTEQAKADAKVWIKEIKKASK